MASVKDVLIAMHEKEFSLSKTCQSRASGRRERSATVFFFFFEGRGGGGGESVFKIQI